MVDTHRLEALLATQRGMITRQQAFEVGVTKSMIATRVESGEWQRLFSATFLATPSTSAPSFEQWCQAALLSAGRGAVLWGRSAARLHALDGLRPTPSASSCDAGLPILVAIPHARRVPSQEKLRVVRVGKLDPGDTTIAGGLRSATPVRSLIDAAEVCSSKQLVMAFEDLHRRGHHRWLAARVAALRPYRAWLDGLKELMSRRGPHATPTDSAAEALCDDVLWREGLEAVRQYRVSDEGRYRKIDLAFPEVKLGIECDSRAFHTAESTFEADRERWAWLSARGWLLIHFTWRQLNDEAYVRRTVRANLSARGWRATG